MTRIWPLLLLSLLLLAAVACQTDEEEDPGGSPTPSVTGKGPRSPTVSATPADTTPAQPPGVTLSNETVQTIYLDLQGRFELAPEQVQIVSVEETEWGDGCLGLADPEFCITPRGGGRVT